MHQGAGARIEERVVQFAAWLIGIWRWPVGDAVVRAGWPAGGERVFVVAIMHAAVRSTNHRCRSAKRQRGDDQYRCSRKLLPNCDNTLHLHALLANQWKSGISTSPSFRRENAMVISVSRRDLHDMSGLFLSIQVRICSLFNRSVKLHRLLSADV